MQDLDSSLFQSGIQFSAENGNPRAYFYNEKPSQFLHNHLE